MAKTTAKKRLASDLKVEDVILLERPKVEVLSIDEAAKRYRASPKGKVVRVKDKDTGHESECFFLDDDKIDTVKRPSAWEKFGKWLNNNHKKYTSKALVKK